MATKLKRVLTLRQLHSISKVLFRPKVVVFYCNLKDNYVYAAAKTADMTYSHAVKLSQAFERAKLIKVQKRSGRTRICDFTLEGRKVRNMLFKLVEAMNKR